MKINSIDQLEAICVFEDYKIVFDKLGNVTLPQLQDMNGNKLTYLGAVTYYLPGQECEKKIISDAKNYLIEKKYVKKNK